MNDVFTLLYLIKEKKGFARNNWHIKEIGELSSNALHITTALKEFHHLRISFHINFQKYLKFLPKCRMVLDLPTCRRPHQSGFFEDYPSIPVKPGRCFLTSIYPYLCVLMIIWLQNTDY